MRKYPMRFSEQQRKLAQNIVINLRNPRFKTLKHILIASGYSEKSVNSSGGELIAKPQVKELITQMGFDDNFALASVSFTLFTGFGAHRLSGAKLMFRAFHTAERIQAEERTRKLRGYLQDLGITNED